MEICTLASGSSGNATLVRDGDTVVLIDAGLSGRGLAEAMQQRGVEPHQVSAIWLTHEHGDHVRGAGAFARRHRTPVYATAGTCQGAQRFLAGVAVRAIEPGTYRIGSLSVTAVPIPHDTVGPVCYRMDGAHGSVGVATDMGRLDPDVLAALEGVSCLVWESNHDSDMLWGGPYPSHLKQRISGGRGHLPNDQSAEGLLELGRGGLRHVLLAHLSETNNRPILALAAAQTAVSGLTRPPSVQVAPRFGPSDWLLAEG